jgi:hypothetical protein
MGTSYSARYGGGCAGYVCSKDCAFKSAALELHCALLPVFVDGFGLSQDNCALFSRKEYLLPHDNCA